MKKTSWLRVGVTADLRERAESLIARRELSRVVAEVLEYVLGDQGVDELRALIADHKAEDARRAHRLQVLEAQLHHVESIRSSQKTLADYELRLRTELLHRTSAQREAFLTGATGRKLVAALGPRARELLREVPK